MTSQFNKTKKIPIKHKDVLKATSLKSNEPIVISPVKAFGSPVSSSVPSNLSVNKESDLDMNHSSTTSAPLPSSANQNESAVENTLNIIQEDSSRPDVNSLDVMKRNINEEIQSYKNEQLRLVQDELEQLKKDTAEKAYNDAVADGKKVYEEKTQELISKAHDLLTSIDQLGASKKEDLFQKRDTVIKLAIEMSEKIVKKQITLDPSTFESLFAEAFEKITDKDHVCIEVNPEDLPAVNEYKEKFESKFKSIEKLEIKDSNEIDRGGCTIETNLGYIDATVKYKLELLYQGFQAFHTQFDKDQKQTTKKASSELIENDSLSASSQALSESPEKDIIQNTDDSENVEDLEVIDDTSSELADSEISSESDDASTSEELTDDDNFSFDEDFDFDDLDDDFDFDDDLE